MAKLFLRDVGSHPERDLEVTLFRDGELQFEADNGKYVHINIASSGVKELFDFLQKEFQPKPVAGATPIHGYVVCSECGERVDVDNTESIYNAELDDVSFTCTKCMEEIDE